MPKPPSLLKNSLMVPTLVPSVSICGHLRPSSWSFQLKIRLDLALCQVRYNFFNRLRLFDTITLGNEGTRHSPVLLQVSLHLP